MLSNQRRNISAADFGALLWALCSSIQDKDVGFNHATTDVAGWFASLAPYGVTINDAFVEDMLYSANLLNEKEAFKHPQGKTFDEMLAVMLRRGERFDRDTNSIKQGDKE